MFIIFGSPRSGTTLLAQSLSAHPDIIVPFETDFIIPTAFIIDRIEAEATGKSLITSLLLESRAAGSLKEYLSEEDICHAITQAPYNIQGIVTSLYDRLAQKTGRVLAGDKSPNDLLFMRILSKTGFFNGTVKIIHIVRDLRDVMVSLNREKWAPDAAHYFPRFWSASNLYLHDLMRHDSTRYFFLRYEDFVGAPEEQLRRICHFLGTEFTATMLDSATRHPRYQQFTHHQRLFSPISTDSIGGYKTQLPHAATRQCEQQAREALRTFRYLPRWKCW